MAAGSRAARTSLWSFFRSARLFSSGDYTLHSGARSMFKIDCDALGDEELRVIATELFVRLPAFSRAVGVPRGGLRLATALGRFATTGVHRLLIVDDVLTTGASITSQRDNLCASGPFFASRDRAIGAVIFARAAPPPWVTALFRMAE